MLIELAFLKCKNIHQNLKYLMSNEPLNLSNKFCHTLQNSWIWIFIVINAGLRGCNNLVATKSL